MDLIELNLEGLNCAGCAAKIEKRVDKLEGVTSVALDFVNKKLKIDLSDEKEKNIIINQVKDIVNKLEPGVIVSELNKDSKGAHLHNHDHGHDHGNVSNKNIIKIVAAFILFVSPFIFKLQGNTRIIIYTLSYLIVGYEVIIRAVKNVFAGVPFDENFLMTIATIGAFVIGEYPEGVAVMLFYQVGEYFQGKAIDHSRSSIKALMDIKPDYANLIKNDELVVVNPLDVHVGDYIVVKPGEKVPLDGVVIEGSSSLDTSNITGESVPRKVKEGENILSGVINGEGVLKVLVKKEFGESTISKILNLVENASSKKAPTENFITKFARYYTPAVVFVALSIGIIPPLFFGGELTEWAYRAFVFLVISCPCALVISIPLGFFGGIGAASKQGILIKGGNYLEALNDVNTIVMDKTGTITKGTFEVTKIVSYGKYTKEEILEIGALGETYSNHPIGKAIIQKYNKDLKEEKIKNYKDIPGKGISVAINESQILLGNKKLMDENSIEIKEEQSIGTVVYIASDKKHIGSIIVSDSLKENIKEDIKELKNIGINEFVLLSGDNSKTTEKVGKLTGIEKVHGDLLPEDKVSIFEDILKTKNKNEKIVFVGDGVNDSPVLARADVGIAMGALGSDAAIEAADIVIMTDEIKKIYTSIKIANKTKKIVSQNIIIALGLKLVVLSLGAIGLASMWQAVFADVGVSIIAILNSIRVLKVEE